MKRPSSERPERDGPVAMMIQETAAWRIDGRGVNSDESAAERVHSIRVAIKRTRAYWRLIRPGIARVDYDRENARLRRAGKRLGGLRDRTAAVRSLEKLRRGVKDPDLQKALRALRRSIRKASSLNRGPVRERMGKSAKDLERSWAAMTQWDGEIDWKSVARGYCRLYVKGRRAFKTAMRTGEISGFHEWRKRTKDLLYQTEFLRATGRLTHGRKRCRCLDNIQGWLGEDHDLVLVRERIGQEAGNRQFDQIRRRLERCVDRESRRLRAKACRAGCTLFDKKPKTFASVLKNSTKRKRK